MGTEFEFKEINTKYIVSDRTYQREVDEARVNRMMENFNANLVNPPKLSFRDGRYYVFDGGHTVSLLKARNGGKDTNVLCKVYYGLTQMDEAILFEQQNGISTPVGTLNKLRSMFNRGEKAVQEMVLTAEKCGLIVDFKRGIGRNRIVAVAALYCVYRDNSIRDYTDILSIIKAAWGGSTDSLRREILMGVAIFCKSQAGKYNRALLIKKLSSVSPIEIIREGNLSKFPGSKKYAQQILNLYNKNMRENRLEGML